MVVREDRVEEEVQEQEAVVQGLVLRLRRIAEAVEEVEVIMEEVVMVVLVFLLSVFQLRKHSWRFQSNSGLCSSIREIISSCPQVTILCYLRQAVES